MSKYKKALNEIVDRGITTSYFNKQAGKPQNENTILIIGELIDKVELIDKIVEWGKEKGIDESNPFGQLGKLKEEVHEVEEAMYEEDLEDIQLELADVVIVDINMNTQYDFDFWETLEKGWDKIKDRKGAMVGDIWVKEEDLKKEGIENE